MSRAAVKPRWLSGWNPYDPERLAAKGAGIDPVVLGEEGVHRSLVAGTLVVANAADAALLAGLKGHTLPPLSLPDEPDNLRAYEYLLRMRVDRLKAAAVTELEGELAALQAVREELATKTAEMLWLADLETFSAAYDVFQAGREASRASASAEAVGAKTKTGGGAKAKVVKKRVIKKAVIEHA